MRFHDTIYAAAGNQRLISILNNLREQMYRYRLEYLKDTGSHERLVLRAPGDLRGNPKGRQGGGERRATGAHIDNQRDAILAASGKRKGPMKAE